MKSKPQYHSSRSGWPGTKIDPDVYARLSEYRERTGVSVHRIVMDAIRAELERLDRANGKRK